MRNFLENTKIARVEPGAAAGTSTLTSDVVDMLGFDSATFIALLGDVTDTSVLTLQAQHGEIADGSDMADITGALATFTAGASDADNNLLALEVRRPTKRYLRVTLARATANAVVDGIIAVQSGPNRAPVTQDASVIASDFALSPT